MNRFMNSGSRQLCGRGSGGLSNLWTSVGASALVLGLLSGPGVTLAEETESFGIEEIVITAERREKNLQTVPSSVAAFTADQIERARIQTMDDVALQAPGLVFTRVTANNSSAGIRGAYFNDDSPANDHPVALFIDEVYYSGVSEYQPDLFDLERIEVLRGPQGTLFGRNVVGGAVLFTTKRPSFDPEVKIQGTYAEHGRLDFQGLVTGPIVDDTVAAKLSLSSKNSDGYAFNTLTGKDSPGDNITSVRGQILITPSEDLEILVGGDYTRDKTYGQPYWFIGDAPELMPSLVLGDPDRISMDLDGGNDREMGGGLMRINWTTSIGDVTSVTAYRRVNGSVLNDTDGTPAGTFEVIEDADNKRFTQELRLSSPEGQDLEYIVGAFYLNGDSYRLEDIIIRSLPGSVLDVFYGSGPFFSNTQQDVKLKSFAVFGETRYHFTDRFSVVAGARGTWEKKSGTTIHGGEANPITGGLYTAEFSKDWSAFTPRFGLEFQATEDHFLYAMVSRGFKSGGFNSSGGDATLARDPFDPEYVWNYEVGAKTEWFDNRLRFNIAGFIADYTDLQVQLRDNIGQYFYENAGKAKVKGLETDLVAQLAQGLTFSGSWAYYDTEYTEFDLGGGVDHTGNTIKRTPKHSISAALDYSVQLANEGTLSLRGEYQYRGKAYQTEANDDADIVYDETAYNGILNARVSYETPDGRWNVALWGKNLTDQRVITSAFNFGAFNLSVAEYLGGEQSYRVLYSDPRTIGLTLTFNMQ